MALPKKVVPSAATGSPGAGRWAGGCTGTIRRNDPHIHRDSGVDPAGSPQAPDPRAEAERLANSGSYAPPCGSFKPSPRQTRTTSKPGCGLLAPRKTRDIRSTPAEVYRSILATQPQHLEALIGLGKRSSASDGSGGRRSPDPRGRDRRRIGQRSSPRRDDCTGGQSNDARPRVLQRAHWPSIRGTPKSARKQMRFAPNGRIGSSSITTFSTPIADVEDSHVGTFALNARVSDSVRLVPRDRSSVFSASTISARAPDSN